MKPSKPISTAAQITGFKILDLLEEKNIAMDKFDRMSGLPSVRLLVNNEITMTPKLAKDFNDIIEFLKRLPRRCDLIDCR